jgi:hypothetical protein
MNDVNLTPALLQKMNARPRVRGRYNSSELFFILNGSTSPQDWINPKPRTAKEILVMWNGIGVHNQLEDLMGKEYSEKKVTYEYKGMTLVGKLDFLPPHKPDEIWEFKSSVKLMSRAKPWHEHQVKLYLTMFQKPTGVVFQPVSNDDGIFLKRLATVKRDDKWFMDQMEILYAFHLEVEKLWEAKTI